MRTLIIGGTGLISQWTTRELLRRGEDVTLYNRGKSDPDVGNPKQIRGDRTNHELFAQQMSEQEPFDCVIDMVCYDPAEAENIVRVFRGKVGQYIFCSTIDVYSKPSKTYPYTERGPRGGLGEYAKNKEICEEILLRAAEEKAFPLTIIRPAATYGEGRGIIYSLGGNTSYIDRIRKGKPIVVHGDGQSLWVMCHAEDVARAFIGAMGNTKAFGQDYHVTGEEWQTWNRHHQAVAEALHAPEPTLVHIPTDLLAKVAPIHAGVCGNNFQFNNIFDNAKARNDLGFRYTITWIEGVKRIVAWLDERNMVNNSDNDPTDDTIIAAWQKASAVMEQELAGRKL